MGHFGAIDETTKRLVGRCVGVEWLRKEHEDGKGFLGVGNQRAMESSLSVVEVASQSEKRGVRTPSRKESAGGNGVRVDAHARSGPIGNERGNNGVVPAAANPGGTEASKSPFDVEGEA